jgi:uncharacterized membrane protein
MVQRSREKDKIDIEGLPKETIAAVVIAQMFQVRAIADEHPDPRAGEMLHTAADLVLKLLEGYTTPAVVAAIPRIQAVLAETTPVSAAV